MFNEPVIITGGAGFIGRHLTRQLQTDHPVIILDRVPPPELGIDGVEFHRCDLSSDEEVARTMAERVRAPDRRIAAVVHLAAELDLEPTREVAQRAEAVAMAGRLLRSLRSADVGQMIFVSTMLVHAPGKPGVRLTEESTVAPKWMYPRTQLAVEHALRAGRGGIPLVILRAGAVYDDHCHALALSQQIERIRDKRLTSRHYAGDPTHGQAGLHVDDLIDAIHRAIGRRAELPSELTLLLGETETVSYDTLQRLIGWMLHGKEWKTHPVSKRLAQTALWLQHRVSDVDPFLQPWMLEVADHHYELDVSRASAVLDWKPTHALLATLPRMIEHLRGSPEAWDRENRRIA